MIKMIFNLLLGKNIISHKESILKKGYDIDYGKYITDNNGAIRYIKR